MEKQKQQVKTNKPPYISITVIDISRKRTKKKKSTVEANNSTKIKWNNKISQSNSLYLHQWSYRYPEPHWAQNTRKRHSSCVGAWKIALYIASNITVQISAKTEIHRGITRTLAKHSGLFNTQRPQHQDPCEEVSSAFWNEW